MRTKTYLDEIEQWRRTVEYYARGGGHPRLGNGVYLSRIVRPHRLFVSGDFVLIEITHGSGRGATVYAVSSKGYLIDRLFLEYGASSYCKTPKPGRVKGTRSKRKLAQLPPHPRRVGGYSLLRYDAGPLRFVELPENLKGCHPD